MKKVLFDANIILDVLLARVPWQDASRSLWNAAENRLIHGYIAAHCITTIHYMAAKGHKSDSLAIVQGLLGVFQVAAVDDAMIRRAADADWRDFEDAVVSESAVIAKCDFIVTRNPRDFARSPIPALTPEVAIARITAN